MDLEVLGRHALLFDDDSNAEFVNSKEALVEWNSLLIDRYDVRHLLQSPPPPRKRRRNPSSPLYPSSFEESQLDQERYLDLPSPSDDQPGQSSSPAPNNGADPTNGGTYHAVAFSYGNTDVPTDQKDSDVSGFLPPFPVPESLLQSLPPTEKLHQIMARTALFVSNHGGQTEIVLRVKQGDNPTFGFLMPDHHLHAYFRFLVDNPKVLKSDIGTKTQDNSRKADQGQNQTGDVAGGALSLLGSVYGSGEDEDGVLQVVSKSETNDPGDPSNALNVTPNHQSERALSPGKDEATRKHLLPASKEKASSSKKSRFVSLVNYGSACNKKKEGDALGSPLVSVDKPQASTLSITAKVESSILEPPSHLKRMVDKIVEFILKNGKEFEAVLKEQDGTNGKFPFLLPSNQYHHYYLKVLQRAQESKQSWKSLSAQKQDSVGHERGKSVLSKGTDIIPKGSSSYDLPNDLERKEKFKMVIGGSKKDAHDPPPKPTQQQCGVSVDAAAAILQAARRGLRNPKVDIFSKPSLDESGPGNGNESGPTSSYGSISIPSRVPSSTSKPIVPIPAELSGSVGHGLSEKDGISTRDVSVAKAIAKTAALAAASEADSSEASLTREQKQKAERLKRAKMFSAMIKSGVAPRINEQLPCLSAEPPDSVLYDLVGSDCKAATGNGSVQAPDTSNHSGAGREREGSSVPVDVCTSDRSRRSERKDSDDDYKEKRSKKKYRSRSRRLEEDDDVEEGERDHKHSRKKHRSHHSSNHRREEHKHKKRHSSSKDMESRRRHKHHSSSEDEHQRRSRSDKQRTLNSDKNMESDDETGKKLSDESNTERIDNGANGEAYLDLLKDRWDGSAPSAPSVDDRPSDATEVSDELRAKVRAMLLATL